MTSSGINQSFFYLKSTDDAVFYGPVRSFTTTQEVRLPSLTSVSVSGVDTQGATLQCEVSDNGNSTLKACGFCWSDVSSTPSLENDHRECDTQVPAFGTKLSGLKDGTKYYVRAYATNGLGTAYSAVAEFTTQSVTVPVWGNVTVSSVGKTKATVSGTLTSDGNSPVTEMGVCWATHSEATIYDNKQVCDNATTLSTQLTGLQGTTSYYLRAYAVNSKGIAYSNEVAFTTSDSEVDVWDGVSVASSFAGGTGTESDPIRIETAAQLKLLSDKVNAGTTYSGIYFRLDANIDLNNREWTPIGNGSTHEGNPFSGIFNGNNNTISNIKTSTGLFGHIIDANICNLIVSGKAKVSTTSYKGVSLLCGSMYGTISLNKIETQGEIEGTYAGGLCGRFDYATLKITNCINRCRFIVNSCWSGGLIGYGDTSSQNEITNCINYGNLIGGGGLVGYWSSGTIKNSVNYSNVTNSGSGIINRTYNYTTIENCFWLNDIANNFGVENMVGTNGQWKSENCSFFSRTNSKCQLLQLDNKDLVNTLNEWVNDNDPFLYRKWEYQQVDGYACPVLK